MSLFRLLLFILIIGSQDLFAQGTVRGKVTDEAGEAVIGGVVSVKEDKSKAVSTDLDGNFSLKVADLNEFTLVISYLGYVPVEERIVFKGDQIIVKNFSLKPSTTNIQELVVEGKVNRAKDNYLEKVRINSATSIDYISSETLKKTGDANASAAVARVSGVSTNGSFFTVRGIGDRYVKTTINGLVIPTLDPFTNNIKLDLFPASLLDNLQINKTTIPELAGDWSGALISLETKDYPEKLAINLESSFGYNAQSSFQEVLSSQRSGTDWLGYDANLRDYDHSKYIQVNNEPSTYDEFVGLGLKDYFNGLGIDEKTNWNDTYTKLGLVQLGLLDRANFDNPEAILAAKALYDKDNVYRNKAFLNLNEAAVASSQAMPNNWNTVTRKAPLNFSQSFSIGNQVMLFNRPLGFIAGFKYSSNVQYDSLSVLNRANVDATGANGIETSAIQKIARETNGWSALVKMSYKLNPNHTFSLLFMPNFTGVNNIRSSVDSSGGIYNLFTKDQFYEQRRQLVYQAKSEHYFPATKSKLEINLSQTFGESAAPDFKNLQYANTPGTNQYQIGGLLAIRRLYRYLTDDLFDSKIKWEIPIYEKPGLSRKIKLGAGYLFNEKESRQYEYFLNYGPYGDPSFLNNDIDGYFALEDFGFSKQIIDGSELQTINKFYRRVNLDSYRTFGNASIISGFAGTDFAITQRLRTNGGLRIEQAKVYTDVFKFDSLGYGVNDPRRFQLEDIFIVNPGSIDEISILPSIGVIYKLIDKENAPMNIRLNYSQSVARPTIRELSETLIYDYEFRNFVFGNAQLKMVEIKNYDFRVENYFENGDNISLSLFYKDFKNHIELIKTPQGFTWQNAEKSEVKGLELEGRKKLFRDFEFRANVTLASSNTGFVQNFLFVKDGIKSYAPIDTISRQMFGQAPYVLNGLLTYTNDSIGFSVGIGYNVQGPRLVLVSTDLTPNVFEMPRHLVDIKISKDLGKYFVVSFNIKDLLNSPVRRAYKYPEGYTLDFDRFQFGTNYILSFAYKL